MTKAEKRQFRPQLSKNRRCKPPWNSPEERVKQLLWNGSLPAATPQQRTARSDVVPHGPLGVFTPASHVAFSKAAVLYLVVVERASSSRLSSSSPSLSFWTTKPPWKSRHKSPIRFDLRGNVFHKECGYGLVLAGEQSQVENDDAATPLHPRRARLICCSFFQVWIRGNDLVI